MGEPPPLKSANNPLSSRITSRNNTLYGFQQDNGSTVVPEVSPRSFSRVPVANSNRHSMALREGFNPAALSCDTEILNRTESYDRKLPTTPTREDRNNNKINRNNFKNNLPTILTSPAENSQPNISPSYRSQPTPLSPLTLSPPSTPASPTTHVLQPPNRLTPTPLSPASPFSPLSPSLSPVYHNSPLQPFSSVRPMVPNPISTMGSLITIDTQLVNNNDHTSMRVVRGLSNRSATISNMASRSEGNIGMHQQQQQPTLNNNNNNPLWGSGGVSKDLLQNFRSNSPLKPSTTLSNSTGIPLSSNSNTNNTPRPKGIGTLSVSSDDVIKKEQPTNSTLSSYKRSNTTSIGPNDGLPPNASPKAVMHNIETSFGYNNHYDFKCK